jgi:hypothetical protein
VPPARNRQATATPRVFYGAGHQSLRISQCVETDLDATSVSVPAGYNKPLFTQRRQQLICVDQDGRLSSGYERQGRNVYGSHVYVWLEGLPVTVTARWGYAAVPDDVRFACVDIAAASWRESYAALSPEYRGNVGLTRELTPRVKDILYRYRQQRQFSLSGVFV